MLKKTDFKEMENIPKWEKVKEHPLCGSKNACLLISNGIWHLYNKGYSISVDELFNKLPKEL